MTAAHDLRHHDSPDLLSETPEDVAILRAALMNLRNPVGSLGLAVDMVIALVQNGVINLPSPQRKNCEEILRALQGSARQLRDILLAVSPAKTHDLTNNAGLLAPANTSASYGRSNAQTQPVKEAPAKIASERVGQTMVRRQEVAPKTFAQDAHLHELLQRLEVMVVTRSSVPVTMLVDAPVGLTVHMPISELLRALTMVVEVAAQSCLRGLPSNSVAVVEVRAQGDSGEISIAVGYTGEPLEPAQEAVWARKAGGVAAEEANEEEVLLARAREVVNKLGGTTAYERVGSSSVLFLRFSTAI